MITTIPFPKLRFADENGLYTQIKHIESEMAEVEQTYLHEPIERVAEEIADLMTSCKTALDIIERDYGIHPLDVLLRVQEKNRQRGYEL